MIIFVVAYFVALAVGLKVLRTGNLFISSFGERAGTMQTKLKQNQIVADNQFTKFEFILGTLKSPETGKYLGFNEVGWLVLDDIPYPGFFLKAIPNTKSKRLVTFNGASKFRNCTDGSIGLKSRCETISKDVFIIFEDIT